MKTLFWTVTIGTWVCYALGAAKPASPLNGVYVTLATLMCFGIGCYAARAFFRWMLGNPKGGGS